MTSTVSVLETLRQSRPEWTPWLSVVADVCEQMSDPVWDATVPSRAPTSHPHAPFLSHGAISLPPDLLRRSLSRLIERAAACGGGMATLDRLSIDEPSRLVLFAAAVSQRREVVQATATTIDADVEALHAVTSLWCVPFLQACHRQWATQIPQNWTTAYCPICASWPAFVEVRGIERTRYARCGRCGAEWHARLLNCLYCNNSDHEQLRTLVPQGSGPVNGIEACSRCRGYVKTFTRLQGCGPGAVYIEDLASVDLDIAALDAGFTRPHGTGYPLAVTVQPSTARRRLFPWQT